MTMIVGGIMTYRRGRHLEVGEVMAKADLIPKAPNAMKSKCRILEMSVVARIAGIWQPSEAI